MKKSLNYYKILGVTTSANDAEIRSAFRSQIMQFHHDKTPGDPSDLCYNIIAAYRILSNPAARKKYDVEHSKNNRHLSDTELFEKYKSQIGRTEQNGLQMTPELLAKLRLAHCAERIEDFEPLSTAKAICYDRCNLLSTKFKTDIAKWKDDFKIRDIQDNFFETYQQIMEETENFDLPVEKFDPYWCDLCQSNFLSEKVHVETVLQPYLKFLGLENFSGNRDEGIANLYNFFSEAIGVWFDFEPEPPHNQIQWNDLAAICVGVSTFVSELPDPHHFRDVDEHVSYVQKCTWADTRIVQYVSWVLINSDLDSLNGKADELLNDTEDEDNEELFTYVAVLKEFLGFDLYDWRSLRSIALEAEDLKMVLFWTLLVIQLQIATSEDWQFPLESKFFLEGPHRDLFHSWLLLAIERQYINADAVCDKLAEVSDHFSAISYYALFCPLSNLMTKYLELLRTCPDTASMYRTVYYSQKVKWLLRSLSAEDDPGEVLEELVEIVQLLLKDPSEAFRVLVQSFPERLNQPEFYHIHYWAIESLKLEVTWENLKLILAGWHFLAAENEVDEDFLEFHSKRVLTTNLRESLKSYDFESLTAALKELNLRNVEAAQELLEELSSAQELPNYTMAMKLIISGTVHKVHRNWLAAISDYQDALLNTPEINYRLTPCISQLSQDFELHHGVLAGVREKIIQLKSNFYSESYINLSEESDVTNALVISHPVPQHEFKYCALAGKIQSEEPHPPNTTAPPEDVAQISEPANTPNVTLEKCERAIEIGEEGKPLEPSEAAFAYLDLLETLPMSMRHGPLVMAASHFLRAIETAQDLSSAFAFKNAIAELAHRLVQLDSDNQARVQSCLTHKHMFSILLSANQCLSKWKQKQELRADADKDPKYNVSERTGGESNIENSKELEKFQDADTDYVPIFETGAYESPTETEKSDPVESKSEKSETEDNVANERHSETAISNSSPEVTHVNSALISNSDKTVITKLLKSVVGFSKVEPLLNIPCLASSDLTYVEKVKTQFLQQFCLDKVKGHKDSQLLPSGVDHAYTLFLEVLHGRINTISFENAKLTLIESILRQNQTTMAELVQFLEFPFLPIFGENEGWTNPTLTSLVFHPHFKTYESINGFKINLNTGAISFLLTEGREIFTTQDMFEIFQNGFITSKFEIGSDNSCLFPNPLQIVHFEPPHLAGTDFLKTLLRVSNIITTFATGMEVNSNPPFLTREVEITFLERLPTHLQYFLRPLRERSETVPAMSVQSSRKLSFDLNFTHAYFEEIEDENELVFTIGNLEMELSCPEDPKPSISLDTNHNEQLTRSNSFLRDINSNCNELGKYFPEFERLKQLGKISLICAKFQEIIQSGEYSSQVISGIQALGLSDTVERDFDLTFDRNEVNFIPSPSCHSHPHVMDASTNVFMTPKLVYGPVSPPRMSSFVSTQDLLAPRENALCGDVYDETESGIMYEVSATVTVYLRKEYLDTPENVADSIQQPIDLHYVAENSFEKDDFSSEDKIEDAELALPEFVYEEDDDASLDSVASSQSDSRLVKIELAEIEKDSLDSDSDSTSSRYVDDDAVPQVAECVAKPITKGVGEKQNEADSSETELESSDEDPRALYRISEESNQELSEDLLSDLEEDYCSSTKPKTNSPVTSEYEVDKTSPICTADAQIDSKNIDIDRLGTRKLSLTFLSDDDSEQTSESICTTSAESISDKQSSESEVTREEDLNNRVDLQHVFNASENFICHKVDDADQDVSEPSYFVTEDMKKPSSESSIILSASDEDVEDNDDFVYQISNLWP